eukprot:c17953_g1_i2.p1 GENE.c17953_g1_i2~~c17953_g1_i2.p1  ORF type:complete len:218 (-),score=84.52 c17953_g1_i2:61-714(-)
MISWRYAAKYADRLKHLILLSPVGVPDAPKDIDQKFDDASFFFRYLIKKWKSGTSPMDIIRTFGPFGMRIIRRLLKRRMAWMPENSTFRQLDLDLFCKILHQSWTLPANGERAMNAMLHPGAYAKRSLLSRVQEDPNSPNIPPPTLPISAIYGDPNEDWMTSSHGKELIRLLGQRNGSIYTGFQEVPHAGHLITFDNPKGFVELLLVELKSGGLVLV